MPKRQILWVLGIVTTLTLVTSKPSQAEEPTPIFVADVQFTGFKDSESGKMESWAAALAAELKGALAGLATHTPMTLENLQAQLGKERLKATFACEDAACVNRIVENFGCSETIFAVVRYISEDQVQVTLDHAAGETVLHTVPPKYVKRDFNAIRVAIHELGGTLRGKLGGANPPPDKTPGPAPATTTGPAPSSAQPVVSHASGPPSHVTSTEWIGGATMVGTWGDGLLPMGPIISFFTIRWERFFVTPMRFAMAFKDGGSDDKLFYVGPVVGYPIHLGSSKRHEIRLGLSLPIAIDEGYGGVAVQLEPTYLYHFADHFAVQLGFDLGFLFPAEDEPFFMGGLFVGFTI